MPWTSVIRSVAGLSAVLCAAALAPGAAAQTLTGEEFLGSPVITSADCSDTGQSTYSYSVSGVATGPYPGFFTETGTVTLQGSGPSRPTSFTATFTITPDPAGPSPTFQQVAGTKVIGDPTAGEATCGLDTPGPEDNVFQLFVTHSYHAEVTDARGRTCSDDGVGSIQMIVSREIGPDIATFREDFVSDGQGSCAVDGDDEDDDDQGEDDDDQGEDEDNQGEDGALP